MIRIIYKKQEYYSWLNIIWCTLVFFLVNGVVYYSFLLICFNTLVSKPIWQVGTTIILLILADSGYYLWKVRKFKDYLVIMDAFVLLLLILCFCISEPWANYFCLVAIVRLYDLLFYKEMIFNTVRYSRAALKAYVVIRIVYWIILCGHIMGCFFYLLDISLIQSQYFGSFVENPSKYYHGELLAFTSLYQFDEFIRYIYAIYFTYSLISTIAFGDIIGKNYIQDIYVMLLIILATIGIALVIEQMYIVFRREKTKYLLLVNHARFVSQKLKFHSAVTPHFRHELVNYIIQMRWREINEEPGSVKLTKELNLKLLQQSVLCRKGLPQIITKFMMDKFVQRHMPVGTTLVSNFPTERDIYASLIVSGRVIIGYTRQMLGSYEIQAEGQNFGLQQLLLGTNSINHGLRVEVVNNCSIFRLRRDQLETIMGVLRQNTYEEETPFEYYQKDKDKVLFGSGKYKCPYCNINVHTLVNCPKCHLIIRNDQLKVLIEGSNERKTQFQRKLTRSAKARNLRLQVLNKQPQDQGYPQARLRACKDALDDLLLVHLEETKPPDSKRSDYYAWSIYLPEGRL